MHETQQETRELLTEKEAVIRYRLSRQTFWRMRENGLPFYRANSKILYRPREIEAFMSRNAQPTAVAA